MAKVNGKLDALRRKKKKTCQGDGKFSKRPHGGGETYHNKVRAGSPPSKAHRRKKPYKGQGK